MTQHLQSLARQKRLEETACTEGAARFRKRLEQAAQRGAAATVGAPRRLLREGLGKMEHAIIAMIEAPAGRGIGSRHLAARWCELVGPDVAAYMTLKVVLDSIGKPNYVLQRAALNISTLILDELRYRRFKEQAPHLFEYKMESFHTSNYEHMARSLNASMSIADIDCKDLALSPTQKVRVGIKLIDILIECTGLVEIPRAVHVGRKRNGVLNLVATAETRRWIKESNSAMELWQPVIMPMVVPPLRWEKDVRGGYRYALRGTHGMVRRLSKETTQIVTETDLPLVYEAVNSLQDTAWKINPQVLAAVQEIVTLGGGIAGIPKSDDLRMPAKPHDIEENEEARQAWRKRARPVREQNVARRRQAVSLAKTLSAAYVLRDEERVFFPHSLDFRGRIYPIAIYLTPQGDDLSRALLTFAEGKPVDAEGAHWLAIHGANCMGDTPEGSKVSTLTMEERKEWVIKNSSRILDAAAAPTKDLWWATADAPLQFLAFCFEWANLIHANDRGESYVCSLPCSMDGSCNGLQHFSALLCDEVGGKAVNVVPQETPQDIYSSIADIVLKKLETEATTERIAALWLGLHAKTGVVNRKLAKRPTMTFGYGAKQFGFKKQLVKYLRELENYAEIREHFTFLNAEGKNKAQVGRACVFMSRLIWEALNDVVITAFTGMAWMQKAARGISKQNKPVQWTVPLTHFPVTQEYYRCSRKDVKTILAGRTVWPRVYEATKKVNPLKQASGVAPNFIHSLDAAVLMLTIVNGRAEGIKQFAMVHDSYGTVPSDCALLARICRQSFARLYMEQDVVAGLHSDLASQWEDPAKCPAAPERGSLDVSQVLDSTYFFA